MLRGQRHKSSSKSGERIDFKFSNLQALQVPKGWDKLVVSIISVETGKTIAKSKQALVRDGSCQWTETLLESIWLSSDDESSKELEECLYKFLVSMGSARSGILGEATVNMTRYINSKVSAPVMLPLKKCNYGTVLQVKFHCLTPRTKLRNGSKESTSSVEDQNVDYHSTGSNSKGSDEDSFSGSIGSASSQDSGSISQPGKLGSKQASYLASASDNSFNSAEDSIKGKNLSLNKDLSGSSYNINGRKGTTSVDRSSPQSDCCPDDHSVSGHSSFNSRVTHSGDDFQNHQTEFEHSSSLVIATSSLANVGSSKNMLDAAEDKIEELRAEAKMWERNARKLKLDLDTLKNEFSDQSKKHADLEMELSAAYTEQDGLKREIEQFKVMLEETRIKPAEGSTYQPEGVIQIQKELEHEIKFQQESYADMALQLKRSQESNIELLSVLQELEDTIEKQKVEIENLSSLQLRIDDMEKFIRGNLEENRNLSHQLQEMKESEKKLQVDFKLLERLLEEKNNELEIEHDSHRQSLLDIDNEYKRKLSVKEEEIVSMETRLSESYTGAHSEETGSTDKTDVDLIQYIETLEEKVEELERDCNELTTENLELVLKLKDLNGTYNGGSASFYSYNESTDKSFSSSDSDSSEIKAQVCHLEEELKKKTIEEEQISKLFPELCKQLEIALHHVRKPWYAIGSDINHGGTSYINNLLNVKNIDTFASKRWAEVGINCFVELNKLLEAKIVECEEVLRRGEVEMKERDVIIAKAQTKLEDHLLEIQELESSKRELEKEVAERRCKVEKLEADLLSKEEENDFLRQSQMELEVQVSGLHKEKEKLEENMDIVRRESDVTSKCLDALRNDLVELSSNVDSHVTANKILEKKSAELESQKRELELHLLMLEEENKQLSEHFSGLEAQLREVEHLNKRVSAALDEKERIASEAVHELSSLRAENTKLESAIEEAQSKLMLAESELGTLQTDCELKIQSLMGEIASSKQRADHDKILKSLANYRSREEKLKTAVNDLELKLTVSEYERQQFIEETVNLKVQLQKLTSFQDEVVALKTKLDESKFEKESLNSSLHAVSGDCEELKAERSSLVDKISNLQKAVYGLEDCRQEKVTLEKRLLDVERDLEAKESLCAQDAELRNELLQLKTTNKEYQQKIQLLELEQDEYLGRAQVLEEDLELMEKKKQDQSKSFGRKNEFARNANHQFDSRRRTSAKTSQVRKSLSDRQIPNGNQFQTEQANFWSP